MYYMESRKNSKINLILFDIFISTSVTVVSHCRRCLRQLSVHTHRAARARQLCGDLGATIVGGGALGNLVAILIERRGRGSYAGISARPLSPVLSGGALGNLVAILIGRARQ
jgi:hypothetical protein